MKALRLIATLMLFGSLTLGMAEVSVDDQISAIIAASPDERVELVNEFKTTLSTLSAEERAEAIDLFRSTIGADGEQLQTRTRTRERVRINQMDETQERQEHQRMNQNQVGSQYIQQNPGANSGRFMNK